MPFPYYHNLSPAQKRIYRQSDAVESITLANPAGIHPAVVELGKSLELGRRRDVARHATEICRLVCGGLGIETLVVKISSKRPSNSARELHGLYEWTEGETPVLTVWMKTAAKQRTVAFKSFIRTVLHELCHHIDYAHLQLGDSFHTEGFFKRESSLYRQIVPAELRGAKPRRKNVIRKNRKAKQRNESGQMELF